MKIIKIIIIALLVTIMSAMVILRPIPVRGMAGVLEAGRGTVKLLEALGIIGGIGFAGSGCICPNFECPEVRLNSMCRTANQQMMDSWIAYELSRVAPVVHGLNGINTRSQDFIRQTARSIENAVNTEAPLINRQVQTPYGVHDVQILPIRTNMTIMEMMMDITMQVVEWPRLRYGYEWCPETRRLIHPDNPIDHPAIIGFIANGLPILNGCATEHWGRFIGASAARNGPNYWPVVNSTVYLFEHNGQMITKGELIHHSGNSYRKNLYRDGVFNRQISINFNERVGNVYGFGVMDRGAANWAEREVVIVISNWSSLHQDYFKTPVRTGIMIDDLTIVPIAPVRNLSGITLAPTNIIENKPEIMEKIKERGANPALDGDIIMGVPVIDRRMFPGVTDAEWPTFLDAIMDALGINDLIIEGDEAKALVDAGAVPTVLDLDGLLNPPMDDVLGEVRGIRGILSSIWAAIIGLPSRIATAIRDLIFPEVEMPYVPMEVEFDFSINLFDYFPFSIPRDIYDIITITLGMQPVGMAGATTQERALFEHYKETGYLSAEGMSIIEPMFVPETRVPRFEINVPMPNIRAGQIDSGNMETAYTWVFDMAEYPRLIAIIRWSVLIAFIFGMISLTAKVITW